jgi:hypothetical protein
MQIGDVQTAHPGCAFGNSRRTQVPVQWFRITGGNMLDFMFAIGQVAAMLVLYGGMLTIGAVMPLQRKPRTLDPAFEDGLLLLKHVQNDA